MFNHPTNRVLSEKASVSVGLVNASQKVLHHPCSVLGAVNHSTVISSAHPDLRIRVPLKVWEDPQALAQQSFDGRKIGVGCQKNLLHLTLLIRNHHLPAAPIILR